MAEENTNIPPLAQIPEFLQGDGWFNVDVDNDFLDFDEAYRPPRHTMERNGVRFADVAEMHIITGKPGNGKTGLMSQLEAATLSGRFCNTISREVPHKVKDEATGEVKEMVIPRKLLHIDTEQGKDDSIAFKNRVCDMAKISSREAKQRFFILRLRDTETAQMRWQKILKAIWQVKPTDIFLDGMLDIVEDYNDQKECQPIIRKCMMLATHYDASLWAVLHENPMVDKLVGTLGSITQRKVSEIFTVVKVKQQDLKPSDRREDLPDIYFKVKQVKARGRDVGDWLFEYVANAGGWGQPIEIEDNGSRVSNLDEKIVADCIERFKGVNWTSSGVTYSDLDKHLTSQGITSGAQKSHIINAALECHVIISQGNKGHRKFFFNGDKPVTNNESASLPFDKPEGEDVPF